MKLQLLPSTLQTNGSATRGQHYTCIVINDSVAVDAGCLATSVTDEQRAAIRDVVLTHAHLDHIAGLPLFIDDLFATLTEPVRIHASAEVIEALERDIFNWTIYPRFSELKNEFGPVLEYREVKTGVAFHAAGLIMTPLPVNHKVPTSGFVIADGTATIAMTGDTAEMDEFWKKTAEFDDLTALFIECAFPDELSGLADISHHLTPKRLFAELEKFKCDCPIYVVNLKPQYRETIASQINAQNTRNLSIIEVGKAYEL